MTDKKIDYRTSAQVGKIFGLTSKRIQQLTGDGILETVETPRGRRYDWDRTVQMYVAYLSDKANGRAKTEAAEALEAEKLEADVELKKAKAAAAKMELAELKGKLHRAEDVEAITTDHVLYLRSMLMAMPGKLALDLAGTHTAADQSERVRQEVSHILTNLADYRYDPEEYKKRVQARQGWTDRDGDGDGS